MCTGICFMFHLPVLVSDSRELVVDVFLVLALLVLTTRLDVTPFDI